jgi:predicted nucleic acid-binding protein
MQPVDLGHSVANRAVNRLRTQGKTLHYTSQSLGEFWNVLTRPVDRNGFGHTPAQAHEYANAIERQLKLLTDSILVHQEWRRMLVEYGISGVQVHDARLVATMRVHGVDRILTLNTRDFVRFRDIEAVTPAEVLA